MILRFLKTTAVHLRSETGNAVAYLFLAIFLIGVLTMTLTDGIGVGTTTARLDETKAHLRADIQVITNGVSECILIYPDPVDVDGDGVIDSDDNPNPPYPIYGDDSTGGTGADIAEIKCPGSGEEIFTSAQGRFFRMIGGDQYTTTYMNDASDGVYITIDYALATENWEETLVQVNAAFPACQADIDSATGSCATGSCLVYWIKRNSACP